MSRLAGFLHTLEGVFRTRVGHVCDVMDETLVGLNKASKVDADDRRAFESVTALLTRIRDVL